MGMDESALGDGDDEMQRGRLHPQQDDVTGLDHALGGHEIPTGGQISRPLRMVLRHA
jgi:hypothetical protein